MKRSISVLSRGGSRIFSRGGGRIFKKNCGIFVDTKKSVWPKFLCCRQNFEKQQAKKAFLGTFWIFLTKKLRFFGTRSPLKFDIY